MHHNWFAPKSTLTFLMPVVQCYLASGWLWKITHGKQLASPSCSLSYLWLMFFWLSFFLCVLRPSSACVCADFVGLPCAPPFELFLFRSLQMSCWRQSLGPCWQLTKAETHTMYTKPYEFKSSSRSVCSSVSFSQTPAVFQRNCWRYRK